MHYMLFTQVQLHLECIQGTDFAFVLDTFYCQKKKKKLKIEILFHFGIKVLERFFLTF